MGRHRLGIDVGGTFTDLVSISDDGLIMAKVPSTPRDQSRGVMRSIGASGVAPESVTALAHGMTVATNALLERRGARLALITTEGFRDILEIGRQHRPSLYDLTRDHPPPLVPRELRFTVHERMSPDGEVTPLDTDSVERAIENIRAAGDVEAIAVCLLFAFMHPEHERAVGDAVRKALPGVHVSLSSEVLPEFREYERFATTTANAYLAPTLYRYLTNLADTVNEGGLPSPLVMQSSGGVIGVDDAAENAAKCVLSGPAGGVVGAAYVGALGGFRDLLTFDMGGTSTDVAPITDGEASTTTESVVAGVPIKLPMVDVHTVSAGGGSIAWRDDGGALRAGPRSAGAEPGPAAYGLGGEEPTVTDANLFLGYLEDGARLGGELALSRDLAGQALGKLGQTLDLDAEQTALGIVQVANTEMVNALRVISVERGLDPRDYALMAFGGAGPLHACALAEELGITTVLVPRASGVLSALGLAVSDLRRDYMRSVLTRLVDADRKRLDEYFEAMESQAREVLKEPVLERAVDLRYHGQSFELSVSADDFDRLAERFHVAHERRYGYRMEDQPVDLVNLRVTARVPVDKPALTEPDAPDSPDPDQRQVNFDGDWREAPVYRRQHLGRGSTLTGPAVIEFAEATCVVRPDWRGRVDDVGTLVLEKS